MEAVPTEATSPLLQAQVRSDQPREKQTAGFE